MLPGIPVGNGPSAIAFGEGAVWVANRSDGTVWRIDPATNKVSWSVGVGSDPTAVAVGEGSVWVAGGDDGTVVRVDPDGPSKATPFETGSRPTAIAVAGGSVWAAADAPQTAHRGGTLRVRLPYPPEEAVVLDPLNGARSPRRDSSSTRWRTTGSSLTGASKVPPAHTLVGALATTRPRPAPTARPTSSRSGPGCATPTGGRSGHRLQDLDGALPAGHPQLAPEEAYPPLYASIVGARP